MPSIPFTKMHGLGNDFVVIDQLIGPKRKPKITPALARKLLDRRFGVGGDQLLLIKKPRSKKAIAEMVVFNPDGSQAEMCGNGIRAVALYIHKRIRKKRKSYNIETGAGLLEIEILPKGHARVMMGVPELGHEEMLVLKDKRPFIFTPISMGNPHAVSFVTELKELQEGSIAEMGREVEMNPRFPNRTNVEFLHVKNSHYVVTRVWERGSGLTLACGTGACAAAVTAIHLGKCESPVEIELPGGKLKIEWAGLGQPVYMTGPAVEVFEGAFSSMIHI